MMRMIYWINILLLFATYVQADTCVTQHGKWTLMIYLNGADPTLQPTVNCVLNELLKIQSTTNIRIVIQSSNTGITTPSACEQNIPSWTGIHRFEPDPTMPGGTSHVVSVLRGSMDQAGMLTDFVSWAICNYEADHYMLLVKEHGDDKPYRYWGSLASQLAWRKSYRLNDESVIGTPLYGISYLEPAAKIDIDYLTGYTIVQTLSDMIIDNKIDVIGLDSCYRAFIETAYELRKVGKIMLASQDVIQDDWQWNYPRWIRYIVNDPDLDANIITDKIIQDYKLNNSEDLSWKATLSKTKVDSLDNLISNIDSMATRLSNSGTSKARICRAARTTKPYVSDNIDMVGFIENYINDNLEAENTESLSISMDMRAVKHSFDAIVSQFANDSSIKWHQSHGLSIYLPNASIDWNGYLASYYSSHSARALPFVKDHAQWADFVEMYNVQIKNQCVPPN